MPNDRTGLLIIRAWIEEGSSAPLRAQVSMTSDVSAGMERTSMQTDVGKVGAEVEVWLSEILGMKRPAA